MTTKDSKSNNYYVSLRDYFDNEMKSFKCEMDAKFKFTESEITNIKNESEIKLNSIEKATSLAKGDMEKRLEGMNEFRSTLKDQSANFTTKTENDLLITKIDDQFSTLRHEYNEKFDKIDEAIKSLQLSRAELAGKASQNQVFIAYFFAIIGIIISLIIHFI